MGYMYLAILAFVAVGGAMYLVSIYNGLVRLSRNIEKAWANIDVLLKQRHDEIPRLVKVCEAYMQYEKETLERITTARAECMQAKNIPEAVKAETELGRSLKTLFAVAENYPDLKANQSFAQLQQRISYLENQIADRRELYNESVTIYSIRIGQIPDMWIAGTMSFGTRELFKIAEDDKKDVRVNIRLPH